MELIYFFGILAGLCGFWNGITGAIICSDLRRRGESANFFLLRMMAPVYAHQYRKITMAETGRTGPLFYHWVISINAALVFGLLAVGLILAK